MFDALNVQYRGGELEINIGLHREKVPMDEWDGTVQVGTHADLIVLDHERYAKSMGFASNDDYMMCDAFCVLFCSDFGNQWDEILESIDNGMCPAVFREVFKRCSEDACHTYLSNFEPEQQARLREIANENPDDAPDAYRQSDDRPRKAR